jgi:hypothetical protein
MAKSLKNLQDDETEDLSAPRSRRVYFYEKGVGRYYHILANSTYGEKEQTSDEDDSKGWFDQSIYNEMERRLASALKTIDEFMHSLEMIPETNTQLTTITDDDFVVLCEDSRPIEIERDMDSKLTHDDDTAHDRDPKSSKEVLLPNAVTAITEGIYPKIQFIVLSNADDMTTTMMCVTILANHFVDANDQNAIFDGDPFSGMLLVTPFRVLHGCWSPNCVVPSGPR